MLLRRGSGGLNHLETKNLWAQEAVKSKHIKVVKIAREVNAAGSLAFFSATNILHGHHETHQSRVDRQPGTRSCRSELSLATPAMKALGIKDCQAEGERCLHCDGSARLRAANRDGFALDAT